MQSELESCRGINILADKIEILGLGAFNISWSEVNVGACTGPDEKEPPVVPANEIAWGDDEKVFITTCHFRLAASPEL